MLVFLVQAANILRKLLTLGLKQSKKKDGSDPLGLGDWDPKTKQAAEVLLNTLERLSGKKEKKPVVQEARKTDDDVEMVRPTNIRGVRPPTAARRPVREEEVTGPSMMIRNPLFIQAKSQPATHGLHANIQALGNNQVGDNPASPSQTSD